MVTATLTSPKHGNKRQGGTWKLLKARKLENSSMKIVIENLTDGDTVPGGVLLIRGRLSPSQVREKFKKKLNKFSMVH